MTQSTRLLTGLLISIAIVVGFVAPASASPGQTRYPDTTQFEQVDNIELFKVTDRDGIWFTTPVGLPCGIGDDGSYGCSGTLPGASAGENEIAWFPGDSLPRIYHTDEPKFASGAAQSILISHTYITYRGSQCAITEEGWVYCIHGEDLGSQILVTNRAAFRGSEARPID